MGMFIFLVLPFNLIIMLEGALSPSDVFLVNEDNIPGRGRVEIERLGSRGTICDDGWDDDDATVICKMKGYRNGRAYKQAYFGRGTGSILYYNLGCTGLESSLDDCPKPQFGYPSCNHGQDAGVWCIDNDHSTVLVDGTNNAGRVEIYHSGQFGTVCDDNFENHDADVVCKNIGFSVGLAIEKAYRRTDRGVPIWLDEVDCKGNETRLEDCSHDGWGKSDCRLTEDISVMCFKGEWGEWSACTFSCGNGTRSRIITCDGLAPSNSNYCKDRTEKEQCTGTQCAVNGNWNAWSPWSECPVTCGSGILLRSRNCSDPEPQYGGQDCPGNSLQHQNCDTNISCPVAGGWSLWSQWTPCPVTCGNGTTERNRTCDNPVPAFGGNFCDGNVTETDVCSATTPCPVDGGWTLWTDWSPCPVTCGSAAHTRTRSCSNPPAAFGGVPCTGNTMDTKTCETGVNCPIDGGYSSWGEWGSCSVTCGQGHQIKVRNCDNPRPMYGGQHCQGTSSQIRDCSQASCVVDGGWCLWQEWSKCSVTCGEGQRQKQRLCDNPLPQNGGQACSGKGILVETCNTNIACPINGNWGLWSAWSSCSLTCDTGVKTRHRTCNNPPPQYGGASCQGNTEETLNCTNPERCAVNGGWSLWSGWSTCTGTCGQGVQFRLRDCSNPAPAYGGLSCSGPRNDSQVCDTKIDCPVDGHWSDWNQWSPCSESCGSGWRVRHRSCDNPRPMFNGSFCSGNMLDSETCTKLEPQCSINGSWSEWSQWSACSVTCLCGLQTRSRECNNPPPSNRGFDCEGEGIASTVCSTGTPCPESCGQNQYRCHDNITCIDMTMSCDGIDQCPDGEDELNCLGHAMLYQPEFQFLFQTSGCADVALTHISSWLVMVVSLLVQLQTLFI